MTDDDAFESMLQNAGDYAESARRLFDRAIELAKIEGVEVGCTEEELPGNPSPSGNLIRVRIDGDFIDYSELFAYFRRYPDFDLEYVQLAEKRKIALEHFLPGANTVETLEDLGFPRI